MKVLNLGLESISFQSGAFFRELVEIITKARAGGGKDKKEREEVGKQIALCTAKHTNIQTTVEFIDNFNNACIYPKFFTPENVLYNHSAKEVFKQYYAELANIRAGTTIEGWVNTANSTVGGEFAKMVHATYYDTSFIFSNKKFSAEGAASIVLHEIGHGFTFFQFLADTVMLNVVLQQTYQELLGAKDEKDIKMIVSRSRKRLKLENASDWSTETYSKDAGTIINVIATEAVMQRSSEDNKRYYTQNTAEELAEIFAVRHGGAAGLIEIRQYFASSSDIANMNFCVISSAMVGAAAILVTALVPALAPVTGIIALAAISVAAGGLLSASSMPEFTKFSQTIGKIRNQLVERLKQNNLPADVLKETLSCIDVAVKAIEDTPDQNVPMLVAFFNFMRLDKKNAAAWREYTDKLEHMATNELFVRAARLVSKA